MKDCVVDEEFLSIGLKHFKERGNIDYKNKNFTKARETYSIGFSLYSLNTSTPKTKLSENPNFPEIMRLLFQLHNNYIQCCVAMNDYNEAYKTCKTLLNFVVEKPGNQHSHYTSKMRK